MAEERLRNETVILLDNLMMKRPRQAILSYHYGRGERGDGLRTVVWLTLSFGVYLGRYSARALGKARV